MLKIPKFNNKKEEIAFIVAKKSTLMNQKKSQIKRAEGIFVLPTVTKSKKSKKASKAEGDAVAGSPKDKSLQVKVVINTTNYLDSHGDVHIPGLWSKSLKENKRMMHVQEHKTNEFDKIISSGSDLKASVETMRWDELGYELKGRTQALVFDSTVRKERNAYMYNHYKKGYVDNHSVGMNYVKMKLAVNDKKHKEEHANWKEYIGQVVNSKEAENRGHFWVILEAKAIEGSAVPNGSNSITPTLSTSAAKYQKISKKKRQKQAAKKFLKALEKDSKK